ncbi:uncharacterized protein LOC133034409 [Cannabis sativa]|uniref:uncharacterized protein LOC133034409 n=1 Tax=Cannabis sativa TaxID=3483 RepID=UPI0029C9E18B|nr:uncharacterized protein LOC133034409 [Cannabis sativa]
MERFGFSTHFINLVMCCVTTVSYSILLNGKPLKRFKPERGIRQGDPMSPYLFLLCNEVLSRLLSLEQDRGRLHGIKVARNVPALSHLMFADDTIIFSRANLRDIETLNDCIQQFEEWSGQKCSKQKSGILFSGNCSNSLKEAIENKLDMSVISDSEKHLGNPFIFGRSKRKDFHFLKSKLVERLEGWKLKSLSKAGRLVYINSVALALPNYAMSTFKIPLSSCRELDAIVRKFWWNGSLDNQYMWAAKSWNSICQPKMLGGLGFRRFEDINHALLAKLAWMLACGINRPWCDIMKGKYFPRESFWSVQEKPTDSFLWRGILRARNTIAKGACSVLATGEDVDVWWQPWIPWLDYVQFRELMESIRSKAPSMQSVADLMYRSTRKWNLGYLRYLFGSDMGTKIGGIQINVNASTDTLIWKNSLVGKFSVKGAYWVEQQERFGEKEDLWRWIWNSKIHPRLSLLLWRVCSNVLPTGDKFPSVEVNFCPLCHTAPESSLHLFTKCSIALALWFSSPWPIRIDRVMGTNMKEVMRNLCSSIDHTNRPNFINCIGVILDCIWNTRNKVFHTENYVPNVNLLRGEISSRLAEIQLIVGENDSRSTYTERESQSRITTTKTVMVDGSFKEGKYGCAMVAMDMSSMEWWHGISSGVGDSALEAEMQAVLLSLQWAEMQQWDNLTIISDSKVLVEAIRSKNTPDWKCSALFSLILGKLSVFSACFVVFVRREHFTVVDDLAKSARVCLADCQFSTGEGFPPVNPSSLVFSI